MPSRRTTERNFFDKAITLDSAVTTHRACPVRSAGDCPVVEDSWLGELFKHTSDAAFVVSLESGHEGKILAANRAAAHMHGYTSEELLSMNIADLDTPESATNAIKNIDAIRTHGSHTFEVEHVRKDGSVFPVEVCANLVFDGHRHLVLAIDRDITERKLAEKALKTSDERYRSFMSVCSEGISRWDLDVSISASAPITEQIQHIFANARLVECNDAMAAQFGLESTAELLGARLPDLMPPDDPVNVEYIGAFVENGYRVSGMISHEVDVHGNPVVFSNSLSGVVENGMLIGGWCTQTDVTSLLAARQKLSDRERFIEGIAEASPLITYLYDLSDGQVKFQNRSLFTTLGHPHPSDDEPKLLEAIRSHMPPEEAAVLDAVLEEWAALKEGEIRRSECAFLDSQGQTRWFATAETIFERQECGRPRQILGALMEITESVAAKTAMQVSDELLQQNHKMLLRLSNLQQQYLVDRDPKEPFGELLSMLVEITESEYGFIAEALTNPNGTPYVKIHSMTDLPWSDDSRYFFDTYAPEGMEFHNLDSLFGAVVTTKSIVVSNDPAKDPRSTGTPSGHPQIGSFLGIPVLHGDKLIGMAGLANRPGGYYEDQVKTVEPILATASSVLYARQLERRRMESDLERKTLEEQLFQVQKWESLGVLAGGVAHDFNNLLTGIIGSAELARDRAQDYPEVGRYLDAIERSAAAAADLTKQMLTFAGRATLSREPVNLHELVPDTLVLVKPLLGDNVDVRLDLKKATVFGDPSQLRQVVMNLVKNASDALDGQPGKLKVSTKTCTIKDEILVCPRSAEPLVPGTYVVLQVTDTGCGMEEEMIAKVFDPFFTTKFTGRGLGLAAVLGILRGHGGVIDVQSKPGKGTTFTAYIPINARLA